MEGKQPRIKILVACHKADPNIRQDDIYMPIQVGKALHPELDLGFQCDNTGDNISEKNASYCELTALYWAWKNLKDVDYIGLCHYRRYFNFKSKGLLKKITPDNLDKIESETFTPILPNSHEVILPTFWRTSIPIWNDFSLMVQQEDLYILFKILSKFYPDYVNSFEKYVLGNNRTAYNMFVMPRHIFDEYCTWLFDILSKMEGYVKLSPYISFQRLYGYLGEILLPVFCKKNDLILNCRQTLYINKEIDTPFIQQIKYHIADAINNLAFRLGKISMPKQIKNEYWEMYLKMDDINI